MKNSLKPDRRGGFTLLELMVVTGLLGTFLVMTAMVSRDTLELNGSTRSRMAAERNAAAFLRQFGADISQRVSRREAGARIEKRSGNDSVSLLTLRQGVALNSTAADRRASLVSYRVENNRLERAAGGYGFGAADQRPANPSGTLSLKEIPSDGPDRPSTSSYQVIAPGVLRLELSFLVLENGVRVIRAAAPDDQSSIEAVIATVVTLDPERSRVLGDSQLISIAGAFPDAVDLELPFNRWTEIAEKLPNDLPGIRRTALQQVRIYQGLFDYSPHHLSL